MHELRAHVYVKACNYVRVCDSVNINSTGLNVDGFLNGAENSKVLYGRYSYHMQKELHGFNSYEASNVIEIENLIINPSVMDLVTYKHVI